MDDAVTDSSKNIQPTPRRKLFQHGVERRGVGRLLQIAHDLARMILEGDGRSLESEAVAKTGEQRASPIQGVNREFQRGRSAVDHQDQRLSVTSPVPSIAVALGCSGHFLGIRRKP